MADEAVVSQVRAEVLHTPTDMSARLGQLRAEVLHTPTDMAARLGQIRVEVLVTESAAPGSEVAVVLLGGL